MSVVSLVSGGLDSTLMAVLANEADLTIYPLFIDYGQISCDQELAACRRVLRELCLPDPKVADVSGIGKLVPCGLTNNRMHIYKDAFLPGRNMFFLLLGASYAYKMNANSVAIGLLDETASIFPDQTKHFTDRAESLITLAYGRRIDILTPLISFTKDDVIKLAKEKGISNTYSCHSGEDNPCGKCIACKEFQGKEV